MTTITYVATVALFAGRRQGCTDDSGAPTARVRFVNDHYTYIGVYNIPHDRLRAVTGYGTDFWEHIDTLARRAHRYIQTLVAAGELQSVTAFQELPPEVADAINNDPELVDLGPTGRAYVQLRVTDLLRFG
ncbi:MULTISPECIES: hypothetical protein [Mycolicibacterium]|uniref:Uncharacterized protein n=1 Tax=Mycolicibacterium septicum DSM 44393 TaxID=1341646 RepID=A0A7X6RZ66_9MYCO|nr:MULTISPECIES: hypothetical protein [Mycolicibacterium]MBX8690616.1 hypothetical protein [Mycobacterium sp. 20091114027_K0903767]MCP3810857.1 hypothetical protein [Mycobacteriaceae bacterium Msp059]NKZ14962.1 hypothetical protein [Mycolicibacterium septicum DSM 44393]